MASNSAAWLTAAKAYPLEVKPAAMGEPGEHQILIKNHALAINPLDNKLQRLAMYPIQYPFILGGDVAGEVVSVGPNVTSFKPGDRVIGCTAGFLTRKLTDQGFQAYTVLETNLSCKIPEGLPFEKAVVLPLAVTTASAGLFDPEFLNLQLPSPDSSKHTGETLLVWGGASGVGGATIQLAVNAGYEVFATASKKNFEQIKQLGATKVFDYKDENVVAEILDALKGKTCAGAYDAVGGAGFAPTVEIVQKSEGKKFVATSVRGFPDPPEGVDVKPVFAVNIMNNHVGKAVWEDFMPVALGNGRLVSFPEPVVAGHGLESVQAGLDMLQKGVSAQKVVVTL